MSTVSGVGPFEAEEDRSIRAVAPAGRAERAEEARLDASDRFEQAVALQVGGEPQGGTHRPHRVGGRGADADSEEIKDRQAHATNSRMPSSNQWTT